jgi:hypothetical protein
VGLPVHIYFNITFKNPANIRLVCTAVLDIFGGFWEGDLGGDFFFLGGGAGVIWWVIWAVIFAKFEMDTCI